MSLINFKGIGVFGVGRVVCMVVLLMVGMVVVLGWLNVCSCLDGELLYRVIVTLDDEVLNCNVMCLGSMLMSNSLLITCPIGSNALFSIAVVKVIFLLEENLGLVNTNTNY